MGYGRRGICVLHWFISRHGIMYQVGMASTYAASMSTFVQSIDSFLEVPDAVVII